MNKQRPKRDLSKREVFYTSIVVTAAALAVLTFLDVVKAKEALIQIIPLGIAFAFKDKFID